MSKIIYLRKNLLKTIFILFSFYSTSYADNINEVYKKIDLFSEVLEKISNEYVSDIDHSEVMDSAINGVLQSLDPYSAYMSPKLFDEMQTETSGKFGGLGIEVSMEAGVVKVIAPIDDTPASRAGIKAGDYIVRIDGEQVQGKSLMEAVNLMRGEVGAPIEITIRRKGLKKAKIFKINREIIEIKSVVSKLIDYKNYQSLNKKLVENTNTGTEHDLNDLPAFFLYDSLRVAFEASEKSSNRTLFKQTVNITRVKAVAADHSNKNMWLYKWSNDHFSKVKKLFCNVYF